MMKTAEEDRFYINGTAGKINMNSRKNKSF
jgi:hypothetical protein